MVKAMLIRLFKPAAIAAASLCLLTVSALAKTCPAGELQGAEVTAGLYQLTGTQVKVGEVTHSLQELPDPAPPYVAADGHVEIYGSATYFIRYDNWNEFLKGGCYQVVQLNERTPTGAAYPQPYGQPWDSRKFRVISAHKTSEVIVAGAMSATGSRPAPVWPDDNINRRIYFFNPMPDLTWVRALVPIFGPAPDGTNSSWLGHSYGGNFIQEGSPLNTIYQDASRAIAFFYEKITDDTGNSPYKTELFMQKMDKNLHPIAGGAEVKIFEIGDHPYPASHRASGGYLAEGPRPTQVRIKGQTFYIVGFSSGDFSNDGYTINYLWSRSLDGPYHAKLTADGSDLLDLGAVFKKTYNLSWVGRPAFFVTPDGRPQMLFHAVQKQILPNNDYTKPPTVYNLWDFFRCIFKVDISYTLDANGEPQINLETSPPKPLG